ncbi:endonuclease, partial [Tanacetum coccineum]
ISGSIDDVARLFVNVSMLYSMTMTFASGSFDAPTGTVDASDIALIVDLYRFALDHPPLPYIFLISDDDDFVRVLSTLCVIGTDIQKESQKRANQARDGKDKVKSKPKSVKVRKSTQKNSKVNQVKKIQLEGLKLPNLKIVSQE